MKRIIIAFLLCFVAGECTYASLAPSKRRADRKRRADVPEAPMALPPDTLLPDTLVLQGRVYCLVSEPQPVDSMVAAGAAGELPQSEVSLFEPYYEDLMFDTISSLPDDLNHLLDRMVEVWMENAHRLARLCGGYGAGGGVRLALQGSACRVAPHHRDALQWLCALDDRSVYRAEARLAGLHVGYGTALFSPSSSRRWTHGTCRWN